MHKVTLPIILSVTLVLSVIAIQSIPVSADAGDQVGVCCAWNDKLADGVLKYKVSGGAADIRAAMITAIEEWDTAITGLELEEAEAKGKGKGKAGKADKADITVKFKKGGGVIAGQVVRNFDKGSSFVKSVQINISGKAFGNDNPIPKIQQITKHEFGHALGLGHANFDGDLMSTTVGAGVLNISTCDVDGVIAANHWKLFDGATTPHTPHENHVHC